MVTMLTVVPINMASSLKEKVKIKSYNTLPNIQSSVLEAVKSFMNKRVGYNELPMACLEISGDLTDVDTEDIFHYIPTNCKETVLFQLEMPEDMIISVKYQDLLDASQDAEEFSDDPEFLQDVLDEFTSKLVQGPMNMCDGDQIISFIPFLEYNKCKFYTKFDNDFKPTSSGVQGLEHIPLARLAAFMD